MSRHRQSRRRTHHQNRPRTRLQNRLQPSRLLLRRQNPRTNRVRTLIHNRGKRQNNGFCLLPFSLFHLSNFTLDLCCSGFQTSANLTAALRSCAASRFRSTPAKRSASSDAMVLAKQLFSEYSPDRKEPIAATS